MMEMFFFFNDTATTEIYTLSLHDALPICSTHANLTVEQRAEVVSISGTVLDRGAAEALLGRSEEHTSELQSRQYLVCRLLLEKKKLVSLEILGALLAYPHPDHQYYNSSEC